MADTADIPSELLQRLSALEQRVDALARENEVLRAALAGSAVETESADSARMTATSAEHSMSRRRLLYRGGQAAVASLVAGAVLRRATYNAKADHGSHPSASFDIVRVHTLQAATGGISASATRDITSGSPYVMSALNFGTGNSMYGTARGPGAGVFGENLDTGPGVSGL